MAFSRRNHQPDDARLSADAAALADGARITIDLVTRVRSERSRVSRLVVHGSSVLFNRAYTYFEYWNAGVAQFIRGRLSALSPALVHIDSLDLFAYLPLFQGYPVACTHHSIESDLLRLRAGLIRPRWLGGYLGHQAMLVEVEERRLCARLALNVMMSEVDATRLARLSPGARTIVAPNGADPDTYRPMPSVEPVAGRVLFLGPTYMFPNHDAVTWFLSDIWERILHVRQDASFRTIGKVAPADKLRFESYPEVRCLGFVPDLRLALAEGSCSVVPIRIGGGTRLKILDAWAMGQAVVSTSVGCEGLRTIDGENILIRDEPEGFAKAVLAVLGDVDLRKRLGAAARLTVERHYSWTLIGEGLANAYGSVIQEASSAAVRHR